MKLVCAFTAVAVLCVSFFWSCKRTNPAAPSAGESSDPWKAAIDKVEQDRGEPAGREATVSVPEQLKHYSDRRRFLAVQAADWRAHGDETSSDFADVAALMLRGELVPLDPLGADYILYGVGQHLNSEPFAHYDRATGQEIPLAENPSAFKDEVQRASEAAQLAANKLAQLRGDLRKTPRRDRARRASLSREISKASKAATDTKAKSKVIAEFYRDPIRRESIMNEYRLLADVSRSFEGESYDLNDAESRRRLKIRLIRFIRPQARDLLLEIAHSYKQEFNRPLPVSSLVRPVQYQRELARANPNAARSNTPPHSTGFAFDLYYRFMSAAEQDFLMTAIANLESEGRVEALRESRDNIHVYTFGSGRPPEEKLIAGVIASEKPPKRARKPAVRSRRPSSLRAR